MSGASAPPQPPTPAAAGAARHRRRAPRPLPALEPDRTLDDWGRSERVEALFDRTVADFLYHLWFRCEVEGVEHVPADGGALVVSNHAGALPPDAAMIAKAIKEEHPRPRPLHITVEHFFKGYPGFSMLLPKIGCVPAHPANVHRLLADEGQLVLVFPEGRKGSEKLYKDRYRLRRFGRGGFVEAAMRAGAPIVPVAVVGAEEAAPIFAHVPRAAAADRPHLLPDHADVPALRAARDARLPAREVPRSASSRRSPPTTSGDEPWQDKALVQTVADEVRATIQEHAARHGRPPRVGLARGGDAVPSRRILVTGLSTYWGGRLAQALERDPAVEAVIGVDRTPPKVALERTEFVQVADSALADPPHRRGGRDRHGRRHAPGRRLDRHDRARRAHENNVIGTMNVLAACDGPDSPVRKVVFKSSAHYYGCEQDDPAFFTEDDAPPPPAADADRARHRRGRGAVARLRRAQARTSRSRGCGSPTASGPDLRTSGAGCSPCRRCPRSSASTRACSSSTRTTSSAASSTPCATTSTAPSTAPPTACSP